jgi:cation diffusion facilitator CzcD-associated flavoprotein CzcO
MNNHVPVLIVGAGPTGLVLALVLTRLGVRVRIVDKTLGPGTTSRALALQVFPWGTSVEKAGFENGAAYLIRPDGYVAFADATSSPALLGSYLDAQLRGSAAPVRDQEG